MRADALLARNSFSALLQRPEWLDFARSVRRSHQNSCAYCRRGDKPTSVHHICYLPDLKPWEYDERDVILLCDTCHRTMHEQLNNFRRYVFRYLRPDTMRVLNGVLAVGLTKHDPLKLMYALAELVASPGSVERFCEAWRPSDLQ